MTDEDGIIIENDLKVGAFNPLDQKYLYDEAERYRLTQQEIKGLKETTARLYREITQADDEIATLKRSRENLFDEIQFYRQEIKVLRQEIKDMEDD